MLSLGCEDLSKFLSCLFQEWFGVSYKMNSPGVYLSDKISTAEFGFEKFFRSSQLLVSYFFLCLHLFDDGTSNILKDFNFPSL